MKILGVKNSQMYITNRNTAELNFAGIALKRPKILRKHHKLRQGHAV